MYVSDRDFGDVQRRLSSTVSSETKAWTQIHASKLENKGIATCNKGITSSKGIATSSFLLLIVMELLVAMHSLVARSSQLCLQNRRKGERAKTKVCEQKQVEASNRGFQ